MLPGLLISSAQSLGGYDGPQDRQPPTLLVLIPTAYCFQMRTAFDAVKPNERFRAGAGVTRTAKPDGAFLPCSVAPLK